MSNDLDNDRRWIADMLMKIAATREADEDGANDPRYARAASNLRHLADTMKDVSDDPLIATGALNELTSGLLSSLLTARLLAIAFELPPYASATDFLDRLIDIADPAKRDHVAPSLH